MVTMSDFHYDADADIFQCLRCDGGDLAATDLRHAIRHEATVKHATSLAMYISNLNMANQAEIAAEPRPKIQPLTPSRAQRRPSMPLVFDHANYDDFGQDSYSVHSGGELSDTNVRLTQEDHIYARLEAAAAQWDDVSSDISLSDEAVDEPPPQDSSRGSAISDNADPQLASGTGLGNR